MKLRQPLNENNKPTFEGFVKIMAENMGYEVNPIQLQILKNIGERKKLYVNIPRHMQGLG